VKAQHESPRAEANIVPTRKTHQLQLVIRAEKSHPAFAVETRPSGRGRTVWPSLFSSAFSRAEAGLCGNGLLAWLNVTIGHGTKDVGISLARTSRNDQYAVPIGMSQLSNNNISGARFDLNRPREDLLDRAKSLRTSLYGGFRPSIVQISGVARVWYSAACTGRTDIRGKVWPGRA
jgi:hypothetical protein